jgi:hypothetical protein
MQKHEYEIYDVLRHYAQVSASQGDKSLPQNHIYDDDASMGRETMRQSNR